MLSFIQSAFLATLALSLPSLEAHEHTSLRQETSLRELISVWGSCNRGKRGFDFVGNDIGSVKAAEADCCTRCMTTAGCNAYSYSSHDGGTCFLKSGRGAVVQNRYVNSAVVSTSVLSACAFDNNVDYVGNDIASMSMSYAGGCCSQCNDMPGCRAFTWTNHEGGKCWFKSAKGRMVVKAGAVSSDIYPAPPNPMCGLETGVDFVGNDIGQKAASSAKDCCGICKTWANCRAFSFKDGVCYLKNRKGDTVQDNKVTSAAVYPNPAAPSCAMEVGVDYVGNDMGKKPSSDAYGCCSICMATSGCKAFSWNNEAGGTCYLKSAKGATKSDSNVKSAVI